MSGAAAIGSRSGRWGTTTTSSSAATAAVQPQVEYGRRTWAREPPMAATVVADGEYSPGLLDLHSLDTELLTDMPAAGSYDADAAFYYDGDRSFNESNFVTSNPNNVSKSSSVAKIKVVVRKRPLNWKEISRKEEDIITVDAYANSLTLHETKLKVDLTEYMERHEFVFDAVSDDDVSNDKVYNETVEPIIPAIFQRTKATCFAYGQTGSGKYTMQPLPLKASQDILRLMHQTYRNQGFQLFVSFFEIYGGKLFDLLNQKRKLCMREDGKQQVCIVGLQEYRVSDVEMIKELIERGNACRSTGTTGANEESSRSHAILQLAIKKAVEGKESSRVVGKLYFIDLAGSERGADTTDNDKQTRIEGAEINKSLLALKECIRALDNDQVHIPFRGSKLTEVLRDSFIGNSRTVMISCISPNSGSCEHTLNTLRYADRVKSLSKGGTKKDVPLPPASSNMRESSPGPPLLNLDYCNDASDELQRYEVKKIGKDDSLLSNVSCVPSGRFVAQAPSSCLSHINESSRSLAKGNDYELSEEGSEPEKPLLKSSRASHNSTSSIDGTRKIATQLQWKNTPKVHSNGPDADDVLDALLKEWRLCHVSCFRNDPDVPTTSDNDGGFKYVAESESSGAAEAKEEEVGNSNGEHERNSKDGGWFLEVQKIKENLQGRILRFQTERWSVPWTGQTIAQVMILWIATFWFVGSWIVPFLAHAAGFSKETLTHRGQALYSLLTDITEGLAGIAILHQCLGRFRPLPPCWFDFNLKGRWLLDVAVGCLSFPLVNLLSHINISLVTMSPGPVVGVSSVEQSIVARGPVAMALYAVVVTVCAPIWEEIVFRGFLLPSLTRYMPLPWSILASAAAFALAHFNAQRLMPLIFLGVVMGGVFARSRNLLASMVLHSLWNGFVFLDLMK